MSKICCYVHPRVMIRDLKIYHVFIRFCPPGRNTAGGHRAEVHPRYQDPDHVTWRESHGSHGVRTGVVLGKKKLVMTDTKYELSGDFHGKVH